MAGRWIRVVVGVWVWLGICLTARGISDLVIFGDSLSDVGNVYSQTLSLAPQSPPYYQGRYSNGPLWIEQLSLAQGLPAPVPSRNNGNDWSYAGTKTGTGTTRYYLFFNFPNLGTQINSYLMGHTPAASQLFVVWGGGNDFIDGQTNVSVPVNNVVNHVTTLANAGARTFLVPNLPLLGDVPRFAGTANEATMNSRSSQFNSQLATALAGLETSLNIEIYQLDVAGFFNDVLSHPSSYGFTNVTGTALTGSTVVSNPDQYLFWDDIHPTRIGHQLLGTVASDLLDTHTWIAGQPTSAWGTSLNWDPGGAPTSRWIARLVNLSSGPREAVVQANSTVRRVEVSATQSSMSLRVTSGVTLSASERVRISGGGKLELQGGTVSTPVLENLGGEVSGFGTIWGDLHQDALGRIKVKFPTLPAAAVSGLTITGTADLGGSLAVSFETGSIALPGTSAPVLGFGSSSGDVEIVNETGFAGLSFMKAFSSSALSLTVSATPGDATLDGRVDVLDLVALANHWLGSGDWLGGDFDQSGLVDARDLGLMALKWQSGTGGGSLIQAASALGLPAQAVPEPSGPILGACALMLGFRRRAIPRPRSPAPSPSC